MHTTTRHPVPRRIAGVAVAVAVAAPLGLAQAAPAAAADVSAETAAMLQYMVAEEKLARDVYTVLGDRFDVRVFGNIARSEQRHMSSVAPLLARYGITDPTVGDPVGSFDDPRLQSLYDSMVRAGSASLSAALAVGATIERVDIADLRSSLATTDAADITAVLSRLLAGSENHLAAFTGRAGGREGPAR